MTRWARHRLGLAFVGGLTVGAMVATGLVLTLDTDSEAAAGPGADAPAAVSPSSGPLPMPGVAVAGRAAPDDPIDVSRAWSAQDPSVRTPASVLVEQAAPEADNSTLLRVVSVVNRGGEPVIEVTRTRGPEAAAETLKQLQRSDTVVAVSVDTRVSIDSSGADTVVAMLTDTRRSEQWALDRVRAENVWRDYSSGAGAVVAVVDTGVDGAHPDLAGQLTTAGMDYVVGTGDGRSDPNGHGTHVAGIVAAVRGNGVGIAGLAWGAKIMPIRVLDANGSGWNSHIAKGIIFAADNGADVINLSLGGPAEDPSTASAVNYAMSKGAIVVAAAGNSRTTGNAANYPAAYPGVVAVASTERQDTSSTFSNTGAYVDIAAPGGGILSTVPNGGYGFKSGTSMATPYVAATAALVTNITGGTVTPEQFQRRLAISAWDLGTTGWDPEFGHGLMNPHQTLCSFSTCGATMTPVPTPTPSPTPSPSVTPTTTPTSAPPATTTSSPGSTTSPTPAPSTTTPTSPSATPTPVKKRAVRLVFTTNGGTVRRGERVLIKVMATYADTGDPAPGREIVIKGWQAGEVALRKRVVSTQNGTAGARVALLRTTIFELRTSATETTQAATSPTTIRWRAR